MDSLGPLQVEERVEHARVHHQVKKMAIMLGISPKNPNLLLKYMRGIHSHLWNKVMSFNSERVDEACEQA
jgi:hypothetical protein